MVDVPNTSTLPPKRFLNFTLEHCVAGRYLAYWKKANSAIYGKYSRIQITILESSFLEQVEGRFPNGEHRPAFQLFAGSLPAATTALWRWMRAKMLPSPSKFHYTFNMRELSRVFQVRKKRARRRQNRSPINITPSP